MKSNSGIAILAIITLLLLASSSLVIVVLVSKGNNIIFTLAQAKKKELIISSSSSFQSTTTTTSNTSTSNTVKDYTTLEATGKNIEAKLSEKEKEIQLLRQRDSINTDAIAGLSDQLAL